MVNLLLKDESYQVVGICMEVHRLLGHGFLEIVYKDAIEYEVRKRNLVYCREKEYLIEYKEIILPHKFYADFILFDKIILEVKAVEGGISEAFVSLMLNYLKVSKCRVGLIVNFGRSKLEYKRLVF